MDMPLLQFVTDDELHILVAKWTSLHNMGFANYTTELRLAGSLAAAREEARLRRAEVEQLRSEYDGLVNDYHAEIDKAHQLQMQFDECEEDAGRLGDEAERLQSTVADLREACAIASGYASGWPDRELARFEQLTTDERPAQTDNKGVLLLVDDEPATGGDAMAESIRHTIEGV